MQTFQELYHKSTIFAQALIRIGMVPSYLHGGGFHFLMVIFQLFYGGFLQVIQVALGWKKIRGTDVTKTYKQSEQLAIIVLSELERQLYATFFPTLKKTLTLMSTKKVLDALLINWRQVSSFLEVKTRQLDRYSVPHDDPVCHTHLLLPPLSRINVPRG